MSSEKRKIAYIDGKPYEIGPNHSSILKFVKSYVGEKKVPTLCDDPNLAPYGACRVCSVEVALEKDGPTRVVASCHTPVAENQHIFTSNESLKDLRKNIVELVLTDHPMECDSCEVNNNCELQTVANDLGISDHRYNSPKQHKGIPRDTSHDYMRMNLDNCINCGRCVRACDEIQGSFVLTMSGRGFESRITTDNDMMFGDSSCVSCGACAHTCPTDAISDVFQSKSAAVDKKVRTTCSYCGVGCNLEASIKDDKVVAIDTPKQTEVNAGHTCIKGRYAFSFYDHPDRLKTPLIKRNGKFEEASWDEAYDFIKKEMNRIVNDNGPDAFAGISSARCTNEENYVFQKMIRATVGTNSVDCCARICHSPTAWGMQQTFGTGAATNSTEDIYHADLFLVIGANPTNAHPVTGAKIKQQVMKGKKLIVLDPVTTELARLADYHIKLRPGTNVAVLNMMLHFIIKNKLHNKEEMMAFFGLFGSKAIDAISSKQIKDARSEYDLKLSVSLKKYENIGTKVRAILSEAKSQNKMQRMVTAKKYKAVKRDWMTQGREVTTLTNYFSMLSSLLFVKENYLELEKKGVINKKNIPVKILGNGEIDSSVEVSAHSFSQSAIKKLKNLS